MGKKGIKRIACIICVFLMVSILSGCVSVNITKPMLKVIVTKHYGMTIFGNTKYYIVYENGTVKKTDKFERADVECYGFIPKDSMKDSTALYRIDMDTSYGQKLNDIANDILELTDDPNLFIDAVKGLCVFGDRYFFDASYNNGRSSLQKLFEYFPGDDTIKEVASFKGGNIAHVELYKPE